MQGMMTLEKVWKNGEPSLVDLEAYIVEGHMKFDFKDYVGWSGHFIVKVVKQEQYCPRAKSFIGTLLGLHCISLAEWRSYGDPSTFIFCFVGHHHHQPALSCHHPSDL